MARDKSLTPDEIGHVMRALRKLLDKFDGNQSAVTAAHPKIKQAYVSKLLSDKGDPGWGFARDLADALGGGVEDLVAGRLGEHRQADERYPNRALAVKGALAAKMEPTAIDVVASAEYDLAGDPPVEWWMKKIIATAEDLEFKARNPAAATKEAAQSDAEVATLKAAGAPKLPPRKPRKP